MALTQTPPAAAGSAPPAFRRDRFTWAAYGALLSFGFMMAVLGPALPYLRAVEQISYLIGALHQLAYALGGGLAGLLASRNRLGRAATIRFGLLGAAVAGLGIGFGDRVAITLPATLLVGFLSTSALIALWAALADAHHTRRAVAMTEGEVAVSFGGILAPLLLAGLAATFLTWRFTFAVGACVVVIAVIGCARVRVPERLSRRGAEADGGGTSAARRDRRRWRLSPILAIVFAIVSLEFGLSFWLASYLNVSVGLERGVAVALVAALYGANLAGRLLASRLARRIAADRLLALALVTALVGLPILLAATSAAVATLGFVITGVGIGAMFPLTSSLHVGASPRGADDALGQVLLVAAFGQTFGPLTVAIIAQVASLRVGLMTLPALVLLAAASLAAYERAGRNAGGIAVEGRP
jgi:fucose permease